MKKFVIVIVILTIAMLPALAEGVSADVQAIDLTDIVNAALALIAALIARYVVPWIKEKTTVEQQKRIQAAIDTAVFAAEKVYGAGQGQQKKQYVLQKLREMGYTIDSAQVAAGIEAAVMALDLKVVTGIPVEAVATIEETIEVDQANL